MNSLLGDDTENLFIGLMRIIQDWHPKKYPNEKKYQEALYNFLCDLQEEGKIRKERKILRERGESNIDIQVDGVGIEVGMNLKHQPEVDRKTTQIKRHLRSFNYVLVVLVGNNSRQHVTLLRHEIKDFESNGDLLLGGNRKVVRVIEVKNGEEEKKKYEGKEEQAETYRDIFGTIKMPSLKDIGFG